MNVSAPTMKVASWLLGTFHGTGSWHDEAGQSATYDIEQTNAATADGFTVAFRHAFADGTETKAQFAMVWIAPHVFRVEVAGQAVGNGYVFDDICRYHLAVGGRFVESGYRRVEDGLEVSGSSSTNADGRYIAWRERVSRG